MDLIHRTVSVLPDYMADLLPDATDTATPATSSAVTAFVDEHTRATHPGLLRVLLDDFERRVKAGESRHEAMVALTAQAAREAAAGLYSASTAFDALGERFVEAATHDSATGSTRTRAEAQREYDDAVSWAVGQAAVDDPVDRRRAVLDRVTPLPDEPPPDDSGVPLDERDTPHDPSASTTAAPTHERPATVDTDQQQHEAPQRTPHWSCRMRPGGSFILDLPDGIPAVWGDGEEVLWAEGESLIIVGPPGVGKTTLGETVLRPRLGLGDGRALGLSVKPTSSRVLYLAMDRPQQIARSLGRVFTAADREVLDERLVIWPGPPPGDLAQEPQGLLAMARAAGADTVIIDSIKDAAVGLTDDAVAAGYNRARQQALAGGVQVMELHHMTKRNSTGGAPTSLADVYGSAWLTAGAGSVVLLHGEPGDAVVELRHLKQPGAEFGPCKVIHDHAAGTSSIQSGGDLLDIIRSRGQHGITVKAAASALHACDKPTASQVEKTRRRLDALTRSGQLRTSTADTPGQPTVWHHVTLISVPLTETLTVVRSA